jgi:hypothetical protein
MMETPLVLSPLSGPADELSGLQLTEVDSSLELLRDRTRISFPPAPTGAGAGAEAAPIRLTIDAVQVSARA